MVFGNFRHFNALYCVLVNYVNFHSNFKIKNIFRGHNVVRKVLQCCALNGGVFFLSIAFFDRILMPTIRTTLVKMFINPDWSSMVWQWIEPTLIGIFTLVWILPLFLLSRVVNALWFAVSYYYLATLNVEKNIVMAKSDDLKIIVTCYFTGPIGTLG